MSSLTEANNSFRIAILGIYHESNTFVDACTTLEDFQKSRWLKGEAIIREYKDAYHELGGAIEILSGSGAELLPIFYAETTPGGPVEEYACNRLVEELLQGLEAVLPVDACLVVPHGAAVAVNHPDMDGYWLAQVREIVGPEVPIVGTLDPHANVSQRMIDVTQGLFPYSTNPHTDQRETGKKAARFLLDVLDKKIQPVQLLVQAPLAISIEQQATAAEPCRSLLRYATELARTVPVLHVNITLGFPYADVPEMGTSAIIITDGDIQAAIRVQDQLLGWLHQEKESFVGKKIDIGTIINNLDQCAKPVLLLDMGDNVGGGSDGNSTYLLEYLEETSLKSFIAIYAPHAVAACQDRAVNDCFLLSFGCHPITACPYQTSVTLVSRHSGRFQETEPRHGGQRYYDMGSALIVKTTKGTVVLLHSQRVPPFSLAQLTSCGIDPAAFDVLVAKGVVAPIAAYSPVCATVLQVNTPGPTQADISKFTYHHRRKPLYPFET